MRSWIFAALLLIPSARLAAQNIGINANGATPNTSAILDIDVSALVGAKKGLLIPRVTTAERNAIPTPATSLLVFNTTAARFEYFDGATWVPFVGGGTLDQAYDFGGAGVGRTITADAGAVTIDGTDGLVSTGTTGIGAVAPSGAGIRMVWNPRKNAFRAGAATGTEWDPANIGLGSTAFGTETRASGSQSTALGNSSVASAGRSTAMGNHTTASGLESTAMGDFSIASGDQSTAMGRNTIASGRISTAMGLDNTAPSIGETVLGIGATFYTPTLNGATQWRAANATDRLLVVGNSIDVDNDFIVDGAERSDALVVLKNGNTGIGSSTPADRLHVVGNIRMVDGNQAVGRVMVSNANGTATWVDPLAVATGLAWTLTGNAGTNPATNFVGTTDAQALRFRTANTFAGNISNTPTGLVSLGLNAGPANTGLSNTFVGGSAGVVNTTGANNTFLGQGAGAANTTTSNNTYVGMGAGQSNTTGQQNVYIGRLAGGNGATGSDNILIGNAAGLFNTANNNVMVGAFSGNANSTGGGNTFLGTQSGQATTTGGQNTFIGTSAGSTNITGTQNTLIGNGAALNANNLTNATAIGRGSRVDVNDGLVLGSVNGINAATSTSLVGIGTTAPLDRLHVVGNIRMVDGNQALGRVLTSDANGTATWQTPSGAGTTLDGAYDFGGAGAGRTITADAGAVLINGTDGLVSTGTPGSGALAPAGAGTRMVWSPNKSAFRAGSVLGTQWNDANIGVGSFAGGISTIASGQNSFAMGSNNIATGVGSTAMGTVNVASGAAATAMGLANTAPSFGETVLGIGSTTYVPSLNGNTQFRTANATDRLLVVGNAIDANSNGIVEAAERSDALVILKNGNAGHGVSAPVARLQLETPANATQTQFTQSLLSAGLLITTNFTAGSYTPGLFWNTTNNNATRPKAGIYLQETNTGSFMYLGTSNNYSTGITNNAVVIDPTGNVGIGTPAPLDPLHVTGNIRMVDGNQAAGRVLVSDANGTGTWTAPGAGTSGTLDQSYDFGGAGAGRTITADAGAVLINGTDGLVSTGTIGSGALAPSGSGVRMVWNPRKGAFRAGSAFTQWDDANIGTASVAMGQSTTASGSESTALGAFSTASGAISTAIGGGTTASGQISTAMGNGTTASGNTSTAMGDQTTAAGSRSTAMGFMNTAFSFGETVLGIGATPGPSPVGSSTSFGTGFTNTRILAVGNAIDANNNFTVDAAERSDALVILKNGNTGLSVSTPQTTLDVLGALAIRNNGTITNVTADNQVVVVGNRGYVQLSSNSAVAAARTITLTDGLITGQLLLIEAVTAGAFEIADNAANNTDVSLDRALAISDTIMLLWNGNDWLELNYSDN
ncbi:MAG: hypothetical protein IPL77_11635 [Flavobacteriales bacterium]|nr:hypothetical protein [Flavobacteriales bacterium]